ncbi:MAG: diguanylate cyclase, partial [Gammaproteobacteria bacterium]|nr:diguanylate cyclase [Gammaproteobacteria bacterium]
MQSLDVIQDNIIKSKRILIINDDLDICAQLKNYLEQKNNRYSVEIAANLLQADNLARRFKPNITIIDIKDDSQTIFEQLSQFKNIYPEMECMGISSQMQIKTIKQFDQNLISGYLYKPVDTEKLIDAIELLLSRQELRREKENALKKFNSLFNINHELIFDLSIDGHILDINDAAIRFIEVEKSEVLNRFIWDTPLAELGPELIIRLQHILNNDYELEHSFEVNLNNAICDQRRFEFTFKPVQANDGSVREILLRGEDVTDQRMTEQKIRQISYIDQLTGLSNHAWFYQNMNTALKKADRHGRCCAILSVNIDNFSLLNKQYGEH